MSRRMHDSFRPAHMNSDQPHPVGSKVPQSALISVDRSRELELRLRRDRWSRRLALIQGFFYFTTGVWPLFHLQSFLWVTGPKTDLWLVQTVGAVLAAIGIVLLRSGLRRPVAAEIKLLAAGVAAVLAACDIVFVSKGVILPIYLLDAAVELALVGGWIACALSNRTPVLRSRKNRV